MVVQPTPAVAAKLAGPARRQVLVLDPFWRFGTSSRTLGGEGSTRSHALGSHLFWALSTTKGRSQKSECDPPRMAALALAPVNAVTRKLPTVAGAGSQTSSDGDGHSYIIKHAYRPAQERWRAVASPRRRFPSCRRAAPRDSHLDTIGYPPILVGSLRRPHGAHGPRKG